MKKSIVVMCVISCTLLMHRNAFSQDQTVSGGAELAFLRSFGFGVSGRYEKPINDKLNWTATGGIIFASGFTFLPIQGGVKYFFQDSDDDGAYLGGEFGVHLNFSSKESGVDVVFSPGVGYRLNEFDFLFRYNVGSNSVGYSGLRVAYIFGSR